MGGILMTPQLYSKIANNFAMMLERNWIPRGQISVQGRFKLVGWTEYEAAMGPSPLITHRREALARADDTALGEPWDEEHSDEFDTAKEEAPAKRQRFDPPVVGADLYIMAISTDPDGAVHGLKVGRSGNVTQRAATLSESMPFNIIVLAVYPMAGDLEKRVHQILEATRNTAGRGREWFHTTMSNILHAIACAMEFRAKTRE